VGGGVRTEKRATDSHDIGGEAGDELVLAVDGSSVEAAVDDVRAGGGAWTKCYGKTVGEGRDVHAREAVCGNSFSTSASLCL
jgi:GH24 family phage-related lysozyme (muramidase)